MRVDGLTTAKMLAITTALAFNRCLRNSGVRQDNEEELIASFRKKIQAGISGAELIEGLNELGFPEAESFIKKRRALEFYNEEHEYYFPDNSREDDGTSIEKKKEDPGFVGARQIEVEQRTEREKDEKKAVA